jgi:hypothetical protein
MNNVLIVSVPSFTFHVKRSSGEPSELAAFFLSTEGENLSETISETNQFLEFSPNLQAWGSLSFTAGSPIPLTKVYVRAKATNVSSISNRSLTIGQTTISYSIIVDSASYINSENPPPSVHVRDTDTNEYATVTTQITLVNYDGKVSQSIPLQLQVNNGFEIAFKTLTNDTGNNTYSSFGQTASITQVSSGTHEISVKIRTPKNKSTNTSETYYLTATLFGDQQKDVLNGMFVFSGSEISSRGYMSALHGVSGSYCQPTSFSLTTRVGLEPIDVAITASYGFLVGTAPDGSNAGAYLTGSFPGNSFSSDVIYVFLDPSTAITNSSGNVTVEHIGPTTSGGFNSLNIEIPPSTNEMANPIPVACWKNMVLPSEGSPLVGQLKLYKQRETVEAPLELSSFPQPSVKYIGSPFYKNPNPVSTELYNIITDPIDDSVFTIVPPTTPGLWEVVISWSSFNQGAISYSGGSVHLPYTILPVDPSSDVYYDIDTFVQYYKYSNYPHGLSLSANAVAKTISGTTLSPNETKVLYTGTQANQVKYSSLTYPNYPGTYTANVVLGDVDIIFKSVAQDQSSEIAHNLSNGVGLLNPTFNSNFSESFLNFSLIGAVFEVLSPTRVKIKNTVSNKYLRSGELFKIQVIHPVTENPIDLVPAIHFTTAASPNVGNTNEYRHSFLIPKRPLRLVVPSITWLEAKKQIETGFQDINYAIHKKLGSDTFTLKGRLSNCEDVLTNSQTINSNDNVQRQYRQTYDIVATGDINQISKYSIPFQLTVTGQTIYRNMAACEVFNFPATYNKTYNRSDWLDLFLPEYALFPGIDPAEVGVTTDLAVTAFSKTGKNGTTIISSSTGEYPAYFEAILSGPNSNNVYIETYFTALAQFPTLKIEPLEIGVTLNSPITKIYDGLEETYPSSDLISLSALSGDDVFVSKVTSNPNRGNGLQPILSAYLGGAHANNYVFSDTAIDDLGYVGILPKQISFKLEAFKDYNGTQNAKIPLTISYLNSNRPPQHEPVCLNNLRPTYNNGNAGLNRTCNQVILYSNFDYNNYAVTVFYNSQSRQGSGNSPFPAGANPVLGTINPIRLLLNTQSLSGSKVYNGDRDASANVTFSFSNVQPGDNLTKDDLDLSATLTQPNRGLRAYTLTITGLKNSSPYLGNYLISGVYSGACQVTPKPVNSALAKEWLLINQGSGALNANLEPTFNNQNPEIVFAVPEFPTGVSQNTYSVARNMGSLESPSYVATPDYATAGDYQIRLYFPGWATQTSSSNYKPDPTENAEYVSIPFKIKPKKLIIGGVSVSPNIYLSSTWSTPSVTYNTSGLVDGVNPGITHTASYFSENGVFVPTSKVNILVTIANPNYVLDDEKSRLYGYGQVTPKGISVSSTVIPESRDKEYDGTDSCNLQYANINQGAVPLLSGVAPADSSFVSIDAQTLTNTFYASINSGSRNIIRNYALTGQRAANYRLALGSLSGVIRQKTISFTGLYGVSKTFDGKPTSALTQSNFSYTGLIQADSIFATTPCGTLSAYYTTFNAGSGKIIKLVGLQPPTSNYTLGYAPGQPQELLLPPPEQETYEIFKRYLTLKPKGLSKYFGEALAALTSGVPAGQFEIRGLVEENLLNPVNPLTNKNFGDVLETATRSINEGTERGALTGIYPGAISASNPILSYGELANYDLQTGETYPELCALLVIIDVAFKELTLGIKEAIWAKECHPFGCRDLNWFELTQFPNRKITIVDFTNADPLHDTGDYLKIEQSVSIPEVLVTE